MSIITRSSAKRSIRSSECLVPAAGASIYTITSNEDDRYLPGRSDGCTVDYTVIHG